MAQDSVLLDKTLHFAARIVKVYRYLTKEKHETIISKQLIRSATSIGANANEAIYGNRGTQGTVLCVLDCQHRGRFSVFLIVIVIILSRSQPPIPTGRDPRHV